MIIVLTGSLLFFLHFIFIIFFMNNLPLLTQFIMVFGRISILNFKVNADAYWCEQFGYFRGII